MCGILGICLDKRDRSEADFINIKADFSNLLQASMVRGIDATGFYIVNRDADVVYLKAPITAEEMVWENGGDNAFWDTLDAFVGPDTVAIIGHTRAATTGSPECNENNHPVVDAPIIGVHNGVIRNHLALAKKYPKAAEVDSAVIFSMLKTKAGDKPLTVKTITNSYGELEGPAAIAVADMRKPDGVFLARHTNPVNITRDRAAGLLMFASTLDILQDALGDDVTSLPMPDDTVCRVDHESITGKLKFVPVKKATPAVKTMAWRRDEAVRKAKPSASDLFPGKYGTDVDAGERCPKCNQLFLVVYMGTQETKCCSCNPYGASAAQEAAPKPSNTTKTAAKRPTSAKKRGSNRPLITWILDSESTTIRMSGALDFHQYGPRGHFFHNGCAVAIVQQCGHPALGGDEPHCPKAEKPCDCTADSAKFEFLGNGRTRHHHITKKIDNGQARKGKAPAYKTTKSGKLKKV